MGSCRTYKEGRNTRFQSSNWFREPAGREPSLTAWLGVYDLAYAIVLDWEVETRRRLGLPILRHYHARLTENGVDGYAWEELYDDSRPSGREFSSDRSRLRFYQSLSGALLYARQRLIR